MFLHLSVILFTGRCLPRQTHPPRQTPPFRDGHCSGWYASYWNAFLSNSWSEFATVAMKLLMFKKFISVPECGTLSEVCCKKGWISLLAHFRVSLFIVRVCEDLENLIIRWPFRQFVVSDVILQTSRDGTCGLHSRRQFCFQGYRRDGERLLPR